MKQVKYLYDFYADFENKGYDTLIINAIPFRLLFF